MKVFVYKYYTTSILELLSGNFSIKYKTKSFTNASDFISFVKMIRERKNVFNEKLILIEPDLSKSEWEDAEDRVVGGY